MSVIDTPALVLDLDAFEDNLETMAALIRMHPEVALRPHAKTHKCAVIVSLQTARGAIGICCQKVSEAEALVHAGARDVLVTNQIASAEKLDRLMALVPLARIGLCCDALIHVDMAESAAQKAGVHLDIVIEVNVGGNRAGVEDSNALLAIAKRIDEAPHLTLRGLQAYDGPSQHIRDYAQRRAAAKASVDRARHFRDVLRQHGLECPVVTGGGTGTVKDIAEGGVHTEIQPGSYIFMDTSYGALLDADGTPDHTFRQSLFVLTTVTSAPAPGRALVDAGHKTVAVDSGMPGIRGRSDISYARAADEAGLVVWEVATPAAAHRRTPVPCTLPLRSDRQSPRLFRLHSW